MTRLKNAPLLEVIFELRWDMEDSDWMTYPYLHGDIYRHMQKKYPVRSLLMPPDVPREILIGKVQYRFQSAKGYPLFQLGPGILTFNATDKEYEWSKYSESINDLLNCFFDVNNHDKKGYRPSLNYYDFLPLNFSQENVLDYVSRYLNIKMKQNAAVFDENPLHFNFGIIYKIDLGTLNLRIDSGAKNDHESGLILQIQLHAENGLHNKKSIAEWLERAHDFSSRFFKDLTKGELYDSFNK